MRYYRMLIVNVKTGEKKTYVSEHQGAAPAGWKSTCVLGYYDKPTSASRKERGNENAD